MVFNEYEFQNVITYNRDHCCQCCPHYVIFWNKIELFIKIESIVSGTGTTGNVSLSNGIKCETIRLIQVSMR